jgi:hypothetical protein
LTLCDDTDPGHREIGHDDPQRQLIVAYTRLFLLPERPNGSKLTTAASVGPYDIRLLELTSSGGIVHPLWLELFDCRAGQVVDSAGCRDLRDAGRILDVFVAEAARLNEIAPPGANSR